MNNENNFYEGSILRNALDEMKHRKNCCCPRFIPGSTGPTDAYDYFFIKINCDYSSTFYF